MKRFLKLFVNALAVAMLMVASLGLIACAEDEKTVTVELDLAIYNTAENTYYDETTLTVTLYSEYAPKTVESIVSYIKDGYYDDAIFYGLDSNKIMVGDLKMNESGEIYQNAVKPTIAPEFEGGVHFVEDSDLKASEGSIGLYRDWFVRNGHKDNTSVDTGRATWFMPTADISDYNGWFCIFASIDMEDETNKQTMEYLKSAVIDNADTYEVYYTGEYDAEKDAENNGLTFNCEEEVPSSVTVFEPKGEQYASYKQHQIKVAKGASNTCGAKIVSAKII